MVSEEGQSTPRPPKKSKAAQKAPEESASPQPDFKPFDYTSSNLKVFAGVCFKKCRFLCVHFDPRYERNRLCNGM